MDEVLRQADVLSLHVPLTPATRGLIAHRELALLPPRAIVINTARGAVLDLEAAREALARGHLAGLGLDAFSQEPLPFDAPIRRMSNAVLTPHMAYLSSESLAHAKRSVVTEVLNVLTGAAPESPWLEQQAL